MSQPDLGRCEISSIPLVSTYYKHPEDYPDKTGCAEIFMNQMTSLHLLAALVTADRQQADYCLSHALDEYIEGKGGFIEWAKPEGHQYIRTSCLDLIGC